MKNQLFHDQDLKLVGGETLLKYQLCYNTYGELNEDKSNAILVFHALSGSHNLSGRDEEGPSGCGLWTEENYDGWWNELVGEGKVVDTEKYFVICFNYIGGCYGSSGASCIDSTIGKPYGGQFPAVGIADQAEVGKRLVQSLGIGALHAVIGPSVGGLCALTFANNFPEMAPRVGLFASSMRTTVLTRLVLFEQIIAIENDPHFKGGDYYDGEKPWLGLALARMISHKTFVHIDAFEKRARQEIKPHEDILAWYKMQDPFQSYMLHQGKKFVQRFDANSYLRIIDMWSRFNLNKDEEGNTIEGVFDHLKSKGQKFLVYSIDSDFCFYPEEQGELVEALEKADLDVTHLTVHSAKGHDSFLLEPDLYAPQLAHLLGS